MISKTNQEKQNFKFRAWNPDSKVMVNNNGEVLEFMSIWANREGVPEFPLVIMQFTGLKDKNGKEIYEGDILRFENHRDTIEFGWSTGNATDDGYGFIWSKSKELIIAQDVIDERYEIIGNIYSDPHLLNDDK